MQPEHRLELDGIKRSPREKVIYALGMLSDVVDGNMTGEERDIHVNDAKEIICGEMKEIPGPFHIKVEQHKIKVAGREFFSTHIPTATSGCWYVIHDLFEIWDAVAIDLDGEIVGWKNGPDDKYKKELEEAIKKAFGFPLTP